MVKGSVKKKSVKKINKKTISKKEDKTLEEDPYVPNKVVNQENKQLLWFFVIILVAFAAFLGPYYYVQSLKSFELGGAEWVKENYNGLEVYHGRFTTFNGANNIHNIFLRVDPRKNNVSVLGGELNDFKEGAYISFSREVNSCRGPISRVMSDLSSFLKSGVGVGDISPAAASIAYSKESGLSYINCLSSNDKTIVIVDFDPEKRGVVKSSSNPYCYRIYVNSCEDADPVEKFMVQTLLDTEEIRDLQDQQDE